MKNLLFLLLFALLSACSTNIKTETVDLAAEEQAIQEVIETLFKSIDDRDVDLLASVFADDGIFMGNDPGELYPKDTIVIGWSFLLQQPEIPTFEFIGEPLIRIQPDGKTAVYSSQYYWTLFTTLPLRQTFWMVKKDNTWVIDFFDFSVVPYNHQYPILNDALAKKQ